MFNDESGTLTEEINGVAYKTATGRTKLLIPWHRVWEIWYNLKDEAK